MAAPIARQIAFAGRPADVDVDRMNPADPAIAHQFAGLAETLVRALLAAGLEDRAETARGVGHGARLGDGMRHRLLAVDVLAGADGGQGDDRVPVVGGDDEDRVEVGAYTGGTSSSTAAPGAVYVGSSRTSLAE